MVGAVNPALPAVRAYEISLMLEVVRKYDVGWVHLDYIRYPCEPTEPFFSFDAETLRLFKEDTGIDMAAVKARDTGNPAWNVWLRWNTDRVTVFVRELKDALKATGRKVKISAAVFPDAVNARVMIGQDWADWGREGLVDMLNPMLYTNDAKLYEKLTREAVGYGKGQTLVCPGIGIGTSHNQNTPEGMIEQMRISKALKADGVVYFSSNSLKQPFLDALKAAEIGRLDLLELVLFDEQHALVGDVVQEDHHPLAVADLFAEDALEALERALDDFDLVPDRRLLAVSLEDDEPVPLPGLDALDDLRRDGRRAGVVADDALDAAGVLDHLELAPGIRTGERRSPGKRGRSASRGRTSGSRW